MTPIRYAEKRVSRPTVRPAVGGMTVPEITVVIRDEPRLHINSPRRGCPERLIQVQKPRRRFTPTHQRFCAAVGMTAG